MPDTGWVSAGLGQSIVKGDGTIHWSYPERIYVSDNSSAYKRHYTDDITHWLRATTFGFSIPTGAVIGGIQARIEKKSSVSLTIEDWSVKIVKGGSEQGTEHGLAPPWPTSDTYLYHGGISDLWGLSWTATQINASNFGVSVSAINYQETSANAYVDHIQIRVYYTEPTPNMKINIADSFKDVDEIKINIANVWKPVVGIWINIGDQWKLVF